MPQRMGKEWPQATNSDTTNARAALAQLAIKTGNPNNWSVYRKLWNHVTKLARKSKTNFFKSAIQKIEDLLINIDKTNNESIRTGDFNCDYSHV